MNFKLLFPTYRTRERWILGTLTELGPSPLGPMLNVGSGEGDIDAALASFATELESCDVNEDDVAHARAVNADVPNIRYSVQDGESLTFADASFDVVTCLEVIEHVANPGRLVAEIARVLKPGGTLVLTCPSLRFPLTYDPVNAVLAALPGRPHVPAGAYGYGHSWLVDRRELEVWLAEAELRVARTEKLSGWLVGAMECYWPGLLQRALKANAGNTTRGGGAGAGRGPATKLRPSRVQPPFLGAVDAVIAVDRALSAPSARSVGLGYVARKA